jgi:hypothetical protein
MASHHGFKEWQVICDALASGRQSLILRKGGIHEGRKGFSFELESFFLFPTRFHARSEHVREGASEALPEWQLGEIITITHHAVISYAGVLTEWSKIAELEPQHIYSEQTVRDRFEWQGKGMDTNQIQVAVVRISRLALPWQFPYEKSYGGCRSWVSLPATDADILGNSEPCWNSQALAALESSLKI